MASTTATTIDKITWVGDVREQFSEFETRHLRNNIDKSIKFLQTCTDYSSKECQESVNFLRQVGRPISIRKVVGDYLAKEGFADLFAKMWREHLAKFTTLTEPMVKNMVFLTRAVALKSPELCLSMGRSGALELLLRQLRAPNITVDHLDNEDTLNYVLAVLLIIQSAIHLCGDNRDVYRKADAIAIFSPYVQRIQPAEQELNKRLVKLEALLTLSYILNESETKRLDSADVKLCLTFLGLIHATDAATKKAMANTGISKAMILDGFNHVALLNDANKVNFAQAGMIPLLLKVLKSKDQFSAEERNLAARGLWTLSFADKNRHILKGNKDVIECLKENSQDKNEDLRSSCSAALWEIYEGEVESLDIRKQPATTKKPNDAKTKNIPSLLDVLSGSSTSAAECGLQPPPEESRIKVMISYQWDVQKNVLQLKDTLSRTNRFNVWMDVDKMKGSILAAMAGAVEESDVILVCLSRKYKESLSCRTEASYAYKLKKPLVPLMVEDNYNPDGWLGALIGVELYYNFQREEQLNTEVPGLIRAIEDKCGQHKEDNKPITSTDQSPVPEQKSSVVVPVSSTDSGPALWSSDRVAQWLDDNDLSNLKTKFCRLKGKHLKHMYKRYQCSPDAFDSSLKTELQMDFICIVMLTTALEELFT